MLDVTSESRSINFAPVQFTYTVSNTGNAAPAEVQVRTAFASLTVGGVSR